MTCASLDINPVFLDKPATVEIDIPMHPGHAQVIEEGYLAPVLSTSNASPQDTLRMRREELNKLLDPAEQVFTVPELRSRSEFLGSASV